MKGVGQERKDVDSRPPARAKAKKGNSDTLKRDKGGDKTPIGGGETKGLLWDCISEFRYLGRQREAPKVEIKSEDRIRKPDLETKIEGRSPWENFIKKEEGANLPEERGLSPKLLEDKPSPVRDAVCYDRKQKSRWQDRPGEETRQAGRNN